MLDLRIIGDIAGICYTATRRDARLHEVVAQSAACGVTVEYDALLRCANRLHGRTMLSVDDAIESVARRLMVMVMDGRASDALAMLEGDD